MATGMMFRVMERNDIPAGVRLCRSAGWNQLPRDWEIFLKLDPQGSKVCVDHDGKVIGTVTTIRYDTRFGWIGMVLVDPSHRRKGVGRALLEEASLILQHEGCVKLDATPEGREVYTKVGFSDEYELSRMVARKIEHHRLYSPVITSPFTSFDLARIQAWDNQVFGADRIALLAWMLEGAPALAFKVEEGNQIKGYCFGRQGFQYMHIGPVVADNVEIAQSLVASALKQCNHQSAILDVADQHEHWRYWLGSIGFTPLRSFLRMYRGENRYPGLPPQQYAILGPEFG